MAKVEYGKEQLELFELSPLGRAYLEYNEKVGGKPFGYCTGAKAERNSSIPKSGS